MTVSIIIPTFNRANALNVTLGSIAALLSNSTHKEVEVLVVDNGSTDQTRTIVEFWKKKIHQLSYFYEPVPGLLSGRHRGAESATGEILSFLDDDVELSSTWLDTLVEIMQHQPEVKLITGPCLPKFEIEPPKWLNYFWSSTPYGGSACIWLSLLDLGDKIQLINANYVWGLNFTIRRETFYQTGGFHPDNIPKDLQRYQGDGETGLTMKANENGFKALYHPGMLLYHIVPKSRLTFEYFDQRFFYQGVGNSYTSYRKKFGLNKASGNTNNFVLSHLIKNLLGKLKRLLQTIFRIENTPPEIQALQKRFNDKQQEGYDFHQSMFKENESVRKWVLKENYFDYKLPL